MIIAKQSTARTVMIGPVLDADGVAVTGGVVGDFKISKNGGAPAALDGSATATHRHTGFYSLALTANDLDTVGTAEITIDDTVNSCAMKEIQVIEEVIFDALFAASANAFAGSAGSTTLGAGAITATVVATGAIDADAIADNAIDAGAIASDAITAAKIATGAITSAKFAAGAIDAAAIANGAIDAATFAADVDAEILSYLVDDATRIDASALNTLSGHDPGETIMGATDLGTGSGFTSLASAANLATVAGYLDTEIAAILADTNELQTDWANGGRLDLLIDAILDDTGTSGVVVNTFTTSGKGELQTEANDALVANNLDHLVLSAVDTDFATTVHLNSVIGHLADNGTTATFDRTTDSLEALRDRGDAAWITATGFSTHTASDVWAVATRVLTAGTNIVLAKGTGVTGFNDLSAAQVNAEVDTALADYDGPTNAEMEARTLVAASYGTAANQTTIAAYIDTEVAAILAAVDTEVAAIKAKTDNLPSDPASTTNITAGTITTVTNLTNLPAITTDWLTAAGVSAAAANKIADHSRRRTQANVEASSDGDALSIGSLYGSIQQCQEFAISSTTLTIYKTDGSTSLGTKSLTKTTGDDPIRGVN